MSTTGWIIVGVLAGAAIVSLLCLVLWRRATAADRSLLKRISRLPFRAKLALAWRLYRDPRIPAALRLLPPAVVLYLAMPLDIVPDFLPVIGQLDDVLIVVAAVALLFRFVGRDLLVEHVEDLEFAAPPGEPRPVVTEPEARPASGSDGSPLSKDGSGP